jgi:hypothetical protein
MREAGDVVAVVVMVAVDGESARGIRAEEARISRVLGHGLGDA